MFLLLAGTQSSTTQTTPNWAKRLSATVVLGDQLTRSRCRIPAGACPVPPQCELLMLCKHPGDAERKTEAALIQVSSLIKSKYNGLVLTETSLA